MKSYRKELHFHFNTRRGLVNITPDVEEALEESGIKEGLILVNAMNITSSVFINDDEPGLHQDFENWLEKLEGIFQNGKGQTFDSIHCLASDIAKDFAKLRLLAKEKIKVGVVGEIYIKYSALGNNYLESFLQKQNCEYMLPGLMSFVMYGADTHLTDYKLYGGSFMKYGTAKAAMWYL